MRTPPILSILLGDQFKVFVLLYVLCKIDSSTHSFMEIRLERKLLVLPEFLKQKGNKKRQTQLW